MRLPAFAACPSSVPDVPEIISCLSVLSLRGYAGMQIRKIIAKRLLESKQTVPHLYLRADADLDPISAMRESMKQQGTKVRSP